MARRTSCQLSQKILLCLNFVSYPFQQNNNLLYLTGFDEPESCLVLERIDESIKFILFVKENDEHTMLWEGPRTGTNRARGHFCVDQTLPIGSLSRYIEDHVKAKSSIHYDLDVNSSVPDPLREALKLSGQSITNRIQEMRVTKRKEEIELMKDGGHKAALAFKETMKWSVQNRIRDENSIAAKMDFECRMRGATGLAYVPVVASGPRSLILHYTRNNMRAESEGMLMFMDAGGKFNGYCSDISRAWPLNGRFTHPQRLLYDAVLRVQKACVKVCGIHRQERVNLDMLNSLSAYLMVEELKHLGFSRPEKYVNRLYPHSIGHYLGLDLHDCQQVSGDRQLVPGMVLTIEPGLYIPEDPAYPEQFHGIGIRIEDDIVIEDQGCTIMTEAVPKEVEEVETLLLSR